MDAAIAQGRLLASVRENADVGCPDWAGQLSIGRSCANLPCINPEHLELIDPAGARPSPRCV